MRVYIYLNSLKDNQREDLYYVLGIENGQKCGFLIVDPLEEYQFTITGTLRDVNRVDLYEAKEIEEVMDFWLYGILPKSSGIESYKIIIESPKEREIINDFIERYELNPSVKGYNLYVISKNSIVALQDSSFSTFLGLNVRRLNINTSMFLIEGCFERKDYDGFYVKNYKNELLKLEKDADSDDAVFKVKSLAPFKNTNLFNSDILPNKLLKLTNGKFKCFEDVSVVRELNSSKILFIKDNTEMGILPMIRKSWQD